jgi:protein-L-isoaspartate O-methyltransferase
MTLIIVGGLLIAVPVVMSCIFATTLVLNPTRSVTVQAAGMGSGYQWACMAVGTLMIAVAALGHRSNLGAS